MCQDYDFVCISSSCLTTSFYSYSNSSTNIVKWTYLLNGHIFFVCLIGVYSKKIYQLNKNLIRNAKLIMHVI